MQLALVDTVKYRDLPDRQKEPDGVMTIKFKSGISAQACIQKMDGRYFGGQRVSLADLDRRMSSDM